MEKRFQNMIDKWLYRFFGCIDSWFYWVDKQFIKQKKKIKKKKDNSDDWSGIV
jgi:hypothetical protein